MSGFESLIEHIETTVTMDASGVHAPCVSMRRVDRRMAHGEVLQRPLSSVVARDLGVIKSRPTVVTVG